MQTPREHALATAAARVLGSQVSPTARKMYRTDVAVQPEPGGIPRPEMAPPQALQLVLQLARRARGRAALGVKISNTSRR